MIEFPKRDPPPIKKYTKKGLKQCFWTKKHLFCTHQKNSAKADRMEGGGLPLWSA